MNEIENRTEERFERRAERIHNRYASGNGRIWTGLFLLLIGTAALLKSVFVPTLPEWLFSWQMLLIILGLFIGVRHNFSTGPWFILILLGSVFLLNEFYPDLIERRYIWPVALIAIGAFLIFKPRRHNWQWKEHQGVEGEPTAPLQGIDHSAVDLDVLDSTSVFGGTKKTIFSKNFKGGDIVNIFGGAEINLTQADVQGTAVLELTQIFGGTKIVVPPHWDIKPDMAAIFGGIDDKRMIQNTVIDRNKVLVIKGTSIFGGVEIKSF